MLCRGGEAANDGGRKFALFLHGVKGTHARAADVIKENIVAVAVCFEHRIGDEAQSVARCGKAVRRSICARQTV